MGVSAPHHGHGRAMKIGKEEMVGLLAAVEMWVQRDHKKEDEMWTQWMQTIADRVTKIDGVSAAVRQPRGLGNHSPGLSINWDPAKLGITGEEVSNILWTTEPRIALGGGGGGGGGRGGRGGASDETGISITAYMMMPDDVKVVADRVHQVLSAKRPAVETETLQTGCRDLTGRWNVEIEFAAGRPSTPFTSSSREISSSAPTRAISWRAIHGTISGEDVAFRAPSARSTAWRFPTGSR